MDRLTHEVAVEHSRARVSETRLAAPAGTAEPLYTQRGAAAPAPRRRDPLEAFPARAAERVAPAGAEDPVADRAERREDEVEGGGDPRPPTVSLARRYG